MSDHVYMLEMLRFYIPLLNRSLISPHWLDCLSVVILQATRLVLIHIPTYDLAVKFLNILLADS